MRIPIDAIPPLAGAGCFFAAAIFYARATRRIDGELLPRHLLVNRPALRSMAAGMMFMSIGFLLRALGI